MRAPGASIAPYELDRAIVDALTIAGLPLPHTDLRTQLRVRNERLGDALLRIVQAGCVQRFGDRWGVPDPPQP